MNLEAARFDASCNLLDGAALATYRQTRDTLGLATSRETLPYARAARATKPQGAMTVIPCRPCVGRGVTTLGEAMEATRCAEIPMLVASAT